MSFFERELALLVTLSREGIWRGAEDAVRGGLQFTFTMLGGWVVKNLENL